MAWYGRHKRAMAWRGTRDPYRIWVSEVMLQQTRVAAVVDYYQRFLKRFPSVRALAQARSEEVMRLWAGLGYYSRARNLHAATKTIVREHHGKFPATYDAIRALPGVGDYTAAAISSIAFHAPRAVLDGNVARVLARLFAIRGDLRAPGRWQQLQELAQQLLPHKSMASPGDWNQALMELGATVCTPRSPDCIACPVSQICRSYQMGITSLVPAPRRKRSSINVQLTALVVLDQTGKTLLVREPNEYFSRMWHFPARLVETDSAQTVRALLRRYLPVRKSKREAKLSVLSPVNHTVTFRNLKITPCLARVRALTATPGARVVRLAGSNSLPVSSATKKVALAALNHLAKGAGSAANSR